MTAFLSEIHFWTTQEDILIKDSDYGSYKYFHKKETGQSQNAQAKKDFCIQCGIIYTPNNKRPDRLRDRLKELEEYLVHNKIVYYCWDGNRLKILLSTGLMVNLTVNLKTGDLINIVFDKQLFLKLQVNIISDGAIFGSQVICVCNDGHVLGFGGPWKDGWVLDGGPRRRLHYQNDWLVVYGKTEVEHPQPWSPLTKDHQRANLHLYWIGSRDPELLAYRKTDGEPLLVIVSKVCSRTVIVVEQKVTQKGAVSVEVSNFELIGSTLKRISVTSVPLQTQVSCSALSEGEERLLIGCIDGSLAILDRNRGSTRIVKASFIATLAAWHPEGVIVAVANEKGYIQYYDTALNSIKSQLTSEDCTPATLLDLSGYFSTQFNVVSINWGPKDLIISFEQGPLAILTHSEGSLDFKAIARRYIKSGKIEHAVRLLLSWDFNDKAFFVLQQITMRLLRKPLTEEIAQYLQETLGCFHNSPVPLPSQIRHKFRHQVMCITRRFFYQLLRTSMFETAFLLAVDVGHHDLFMDLHYIAVKLGETEMAAAARAQASALLSRCSSEASNCSRSLCSQCSDSGSCSSTANYDENINSRSRTDLPTENVMTTDFMQPNPTTYKSEENEVKSIDVSRKAFPPRATYVKAPQVPTDFMKQNQNPPIPPLPFFRSLGVSYIQQYVENVSNQAKTTTSNDIPTNKDMDHNISGLPQYSPHPPASGLNFFKETKHKYMPLNKESPPLPRVSNFGSSKLSKSCQNLDSDMHITFPPPSAFLNVQNHVSFDNLIDFEDAAPPKPTVNIIAKKVHSKVKFSDTVTAFIVPEVKRSVNVKPPLPSHLTDPQRELAESLPLCHPNEDYLKDFAPIRKEGETETSESSTTTTQPKIKVVPTDFMKQNQNPPIPPLPFFRSLGVSYIQQYVENVSNQAKTTTSNDIPTNKDMDHNISGLPQYSPHPPASGLNFFKETKHKYMPLNKESPPLPRVSNFGSSKLSKSCQNLDSDMHITFPPPSAFLNVQNHVSFDNLIDFEDAAPPKPTVNIIAKKVHSKVKFSDTVTAFIVPEVKRSVNVKPPLPSHLTDPQRELAESLPLCHPNEDYLKDFAPIRKEGETETSESSTTTTQPKIKVVHFGVV